MLGVMMTLQDIIQKFVETDKPEFGEPTAPLPSDQLLQRTPFYNPNCQSRAAQDQLNLQLDELIQKTIEEIKKKQGDNAHLNLAHRKQEKQPCCISFIMGLDMSLTIEEENILERLLTEQTSAAASCCPVR